MNFNPDPRVPFVPFAAASNAEDCSLSSNSDDFDNFVIESDDERKPAAREIPEPACVSRPGLLQVTGRPWINNALTDNMLKKLTKNPHRDFKNLVTQILDKAKNETITGHVWLTLQCALEDVLTLTREQEKAQIKQMESLAFLLILLETGGKTTE